MSTDNPTSDGPPNNPVSWDRFVKVNEKRAALEARVAELETQAQSWQEKAATADTLAQQVQQWQTRAEQATQGLTEYQAAARIGVTDPELYEAARWAHSRLPEADRPGFSDALQSWKDDPSAAPLVLRPHLAPAPAPAPAAPAAPQAAPTSAAPQAAPPNPNTGTAPYSGAPEAVDLGNLEHYRTHRAELRKTKLF